MIRPPDTPELRSLLPAGVEVCVSARAPTGTACLADVERRAVATMTAGRCRAFTHGRACARAVLAALGLPNTAIPFGANREPIWPDGIVGSISHCGAIAAAAASRSSARGGIGIDIEIAEPLDDSTLDLICCPAELKWLQNRENAREYAKLIFSAKESVYKCIWPTVQRFVDFRDIAIRIDAEAGTFTPAKWSNDLPASVVGAVTGRYAIRDRWIMTAASLPPVAG